MSSWTSKDTYKLYNIQRWSGGYFNVNAAGHLCVQPRPDSEHTPIDLYELIAEIHALKLSTPVLVRFTDILQHRIDRLYQAFDHARQLHQYQGDYSVAYPIKVNQQASVVKEISRHERQVGLEAGSKTELMAVLALAHSPNGLVICNGYKDAEYIRLALIGQRLGHRVFIVLEKPSELALVLRESAQLGIRPQLGIRVRLSSSGSGKWQNSGGEKSKFGLSSQQLLQAIAQLKKAEALDCLQLLHFHLGSQITNLDFIRSGSRECAQYYAELRRLGAPIDYVDVGGGLSVDYDGTRSQNYFSMNYSPEEYAEAIVAALTTVCTHQSLPQPGIISESGRALTAHHAILITNVIDVDKTADISHIPEKIPATLDVLDKLTTLIEAVGSDRVQPGEAYQQGRHLLNEIFQGFAWGDLQLEQKSRAEEQFHYLCCVIHKHLNPASRSHRDVLDALNEKFSDRYFCNFSLFQSLPDIWAIDQIFPIVPLHRLDEEPLRRATLHDITCDSDGRINQYVDNHGVETSLPLHDVNSGPYYLGIFLVGAYQEILGDMHNLFGDTNSVNVMLTEDGYKLSQTLRGDSSDYVLRHVHFDPQQFLERYKEKLIVQALDSNLQAQYLEELEAGLTGYTYLED